MGIYFTYIIMYGFNLIIYRLYVDCEFVPDSSRYFSRKCRKKFHISMKFITKKNNK